MWLPLILRAIRAPPAAFRLKPEATRSFLLQTLTPEVTRQRLRDMERSCECGR